MLLYNFLLIIITILKIRAYLPHSLNLELLKNIRRMTAECKTVILPLVKRCNLELEETVRKSKS